MTEIQMQPPAGGCDRCGGSDSLEWFDLDWLCADCAKDLGYTN